MTLEEQLAKIEKRMAEIKVEIEKAETEKRSIEPVQLEGFKKELNGDGDELGLVQRQKLLREQLELRDASNFTPYTSKITESQKQKEERDSGLEAIGEKLKEARSKVVSGSLNDMTVKISNEELRSSGIDTSGIILTQIYNTSLEQSQQQYSNAGDMVRAVDAEGNQVYSQGFEKSVDDADYKDDGQTYTDTDTSVGKVSIYAGKVTAKTTVEEGLAKLTSVPYAQKMLSNVMTSIKKKVAKAIVLGDGSSIDGAGGILKKFVGIYNATGDVAPVEVEASALNVDMIIDLIFALGNDETSGGAGEMLMLNKKDLQALIKLKDSSARYYYSFNPNQGGNTGTLTVGERNKTGDKSEITTNYVINSACKALVDTGTSVDDYTMIYGNLNDYVMPIFGGIEIRHKREDNGDYTTFASLYAGGSPGGNKKFVVVKKVAA